MTTIHGTIYVADDAPPGGRVRWVDGLTVPAEHRAQVSLHVSRLARRHGLGPVGVRYFESGIQPHPAGGGTTVGGIVVADSPNTIGLHCGMRGDEFVAHTIAHEMYHLVQHARGLERTQQSADAFADAYLVELLTRTPE